MVLFVKKTQCWPVITTSWEPTPVVKNYLTSPTPRSSRKKGKAKKRDKEDPLVRYRRTPGGSITQFLQREQTDHVFSTQVKSWTAKHDAKPYTVV